MQGWSGSLEAKDLDMSGTVLLLGLRKACFTLGVAVLEAMSVGSEAGNKFPQWSWSQHGPPSRKASSAASFA